MMLGGSSFFTSLDPPETNRTLTDTLPGAGVDHTSNLDNDALCDWEPAVLFRHSGWRNDRKRVWKALRRTKQTLNRLTDFQQCGKYAYVYQNLDNPDEYAIRGSTCHDRFCLPCARERSRIIATNVLDKLEAEQARFLTLTLRSDTEPLGDLITKLTHDFAALRRSKLWRNKVTGGVAFIEVKWYAKTQRWHPHLHCLVQGRYLPVSDLSKAWLKVTGTSKIVDIQYANNNAKVTHYITKYASKPLDKSVIIEPDRLDEAVLALKGKRLCMTFGTWRGYCLTKPLEDGTWIQLGTLTEIVQRAEAGDARAQTALNYLQISFAQSPRASPSAVEPASTTAQTQGIFAFTVPAILQWDALGIH